MAKRFPPGLCAHCLTFNNVLSSDHVLPESWYPTTTPENLAKWQMPSCEPCNRKYGKIEDELLLRLGLGLDPTRSASKGIPQKLHRSFDPAKSRDQRDACARQAKRKDLVQAVVPQSAVRFENILPNFGPYPGMAVEDIIPIGIPAVELNAFAEKLVRGATYVLHGKFIEDRSKILILSLMHEQCFEAEIVRRAIKRYGTTYEFGPGFRVGAGDGWFRFEIWGVLVIYARLVGG